jgi:hypothetical protein
MTLSKNRPLANNRKIEDGLLPRGFQILSCYWVMLYFLRFVLNNLQYVLYFLHFVLNNLQLITSLFVIYEKTLSKK